MASTSMVSRKSVLISNAIPTSSRAPDAAFFRRGTPRMVLLNASTLHKTARKGSVAAFTSGRFFGYGCVHDLPEALDASVEFPVGRANAKRARRLLAE